MFNFINKFLGNVKDQGYIAALGNEMESCDVFTSLSNNFFINKKDW